MDMTSIFHLVTGNPIITIPSLIAGLIVGPIVWKSIRVFYIYLLPIDKLIGIGEVKLNRVSLLLRSVILAKTHDDILSKRMLDDLDRAGDRFDVAWDKGLKGEKI